MTMTKNGRYYLYMLIIITMAALNARTNLLHLFVGFLIILLFASWRLSRSNVRNISLLIEAPHEIFAKSPLSIRYLFSNHTNYDKFGLEVKDEITKQTFGITTIPSQSTISLYSNISFPQRGVLTWKHIKLTSEFPFSFIIQNYKLLIENTLLVLPKPLKYSSIKLPTHASMFREGSFSSITRTASQDFAGLREYHTGDSHKSIDWKATAKSNKLIVKEFEEDLPSGVSILLDLPDTGYEEDRAKDFFEKSITLAASMVWEIAHQGYLILFAYADKIVSYKRGREHALNILRAMAYANFYEDIKRENHIPAILSQIPIGTTVILISFNFREEVKQHLRKLLASGCYIIAIAIDSEANIEEIPGINLFKLRTIGEEKIDLHIF